MSAELQIEQSVGHKDHHQFLDSAVQKCYMSVKKKENDVTIKQEEKSKPQSTLFFLLLPWV